MYFIQSGEVGAGFKLYDQPLSLERYNLTHSLLSKDYFGDYYVLYNIKSEFCFLAVQEVHAFAISKKFLLFDVFAHFEESYFASFQQRSQGRYMDFRTRVVHQKENNIVKANKHN